MREHGGPSRLVRWRRVVAAHRRAVAVLVTAALVLAIAGLALAARGGDAVRTMDLRVAGTPEPGQGAITLDATLYLPRVGGRVPAVLIAHGFGGSKADAADDARWLAARGYAVLAYTARGFGRSGGLIHLDSPDYEVKDAQRMLDLLAARPEVRLDAPGDPRVGVVGGSYGGALALLLAGVDHRVDAIVPSITWNDLRQSLFPQFAVAAGPQRTPAQVIPTGGPGVFKRMWAADLLGGLVFGGTDAAGPAGATGTAEGAASAMAAGACGRLALDICLNYARTATTGVPTEQALQMLAVSSPARVLDRIIAPTLLVQGETDSLFPLSEADANAAGIAAHGTTVKVAWVSGGHDVGLNVQRMRELTLGWLDRYVRGAGPGTDVRFEAAIQGAAVSSDDSDPIPQLRAAPGYPGLPGRAGSAALRELSLPLSGGQQTAVSPPGGAPAAVSTLPGLAFGGAVSGSDLGLGSGLAVLPGQSATFDTARLTHRITVVGGGQVTVHVTSTTRDAVLFASLLDIANDGSAVQPRGLVAPVHLTGLPPEGRDVTVALPAIALDISPGHRLRVVLATTDAGYAVPQEPRAYRIRLAGDRSVRLPQVAMTTVGGVPARTLGLIAGGMLAAALLGAAVLRLRRRRNATAEFDRDLEQVPLALCRLSKTYPGGLRAVSDLSFRVEVGQVVGLLGPNGAGKTTALRMVMGLVHPSEGEVRMFGRPIVPGAAVLSRVGAFVEGPGFLPHLSGLDNLRLYWRATGRPAHDAFLGVALDVAGLGDDVHRRVRTYSHGMKQRLAIAQAMLGLPDLLVLDEPTNGLDPPQIRQMRDMLARYAETGRTVVVSSHLLAEVEQTCTHVVVMHRGRLIAQGPVDDIVAVASTVAVDVDDPARAVSVARRVAGVHDVIATPAGLVVRVARPVRADLVGALVDAGLRVERVAPQRGLEEAFLTLVGDGVAVQANQQAHQEKG